MDDVALRRAIYRHFATSGRAPAPSDVGASHADLARLAKARAVVLDEDGAIEFSNPFAAGPTDFEVTTDGGRWFGTCVWDALGILAALGRDGGVRTSCADCGDSIELEIASGAVAPVDAVVHFLVPASAWYDDLRFT